MVLRSINRLAFAAALAAASLTVSGAVQAQMQPSPTAIAEAKELVVLKGATAMFDPLIPGVIESAKNTFLPTNPQLGPQLNQVAAELRREYEPRRAELINQVAIIYAQHFTEPELRDIITFYRSPAGQKMISAEPLAIDASLKAAQAWATRLSDEVLERFRAEMKKKGYDL